MKPSLRFAILERDGFRCHYCGNSGDTTTLEVDHVNPKANGGTDDESNLVTSCGDCNRGKSAKVIEMPARKSRATKTPHPLVGKFFHAIEPCKTCGHPDVAWQGYIKAVLPSGTFLVQLFEWFAGQESTQHLVRPETAEGWAFYDSSNDMTAMYESWWSYRHKDCLK